MATESLRHYWRLLYFRWCHTTDEYNTIDLSYIDVLFAWVRDNRITVPIIMIIFCNSSQAVVSPLLR